jgi:hypothetical protein
LDVIAAVGGFSGAIFGVIKIFGMMFSKIELQMELTAKIFRLKRKSDLKLPYHWVNRKLKQEDVDELKQNFERFKLKKTWDRKL